MRTPLFRLLLYLAVAVLGLFLAYAGVILPVHHTEPGPRPVPLYFCIVQVALGIFLLVVASRAIWEILDAEQPPSTKVEPWDDDPVALCTSCLADVEPLKHYCPHCGEVTGNYTPYLPFVNIPFEYNFHGQVWHRVWFEKGIPLRTRIGLFAFLLLVAPIMLLGLPWALLRRHRMTGEQSV